jgi:hypothetical protein
LVLRLYDKMTVEYNRQFELLSQLTLVKLLFMLGLGPVKPTTKTVPKEAGIRTVSVNRVCIYVPLWNKVLSSLERLLISHSF